jgi:hypothetical protein
MVANVTGVSEEHTATIFNAEDGNHLPGYMALHSSKTIVVIFSLMGICSLTTVKLSYLMVEI